MKATFVFIVVPIQHVPFIPPRLILIEVGPNVLKLLSCDAAPVLPSPTAMSLNFDPDSKAQL